MLRDPKAILYSDSDGVICDFYAQAEKVLGHKWLSDDSKKHDHGWILNQHEEFWETIAPMPDWKIYWDYIEKYNPHILTAVPDWDHNFSEVDRGNENGTEGIFLHFQDHVSTSFTEKTNNCTQ